MKPLFIGDSIAEGYRKQGEGTTLVGASPSKVLSFLQQGLANNLNPYQNRVINLSTGISNNPTDIASIKKQFELLSKAGATVNVLGAAKGTYDPQNQQLKELSDQFGMRFLGGFDPGPDRVHPLSYSSYNGTDLSAPASNASFSTSVTSSDTKEKPQPKVSKQDQYKDYAKYALFQNLLNQQTQPTIADQLMGELYQGVLG